MDNEKFETHPLLPSGQWEGFYCYGSSKEQHKMKIELDFQEGEVSGGGIDDVAAFTWKGTYDLENFKISMMKTYATHQIFYKGDVDENGIWGMWNSLNEDLEKLGFSPEMLKEMMAAFANEMRGGFHIWPVKRARGKEAEVEEKLKSELLEELLLEI